MLKTFTISKREQERWEALDKANSAKDRIYGCRPIVGEQYRGIVYDHEGRKQFIVTSRVEKVTMLMWTVGFIGGEDIACWWLIETASGSIYAVAEIR